MSMESQHGETPTNTKIANPDYSSLRTISIMKQAEIQRLYDRIDSFEERCQATHHTDLEEVWEILYDVRFELRKDLHTEGRASRILFWIAASCLALAGLLALLDATIQISLR